MLLLLQHECMNHVTACYCLSPPRGLLNDPNIDYLIRLSYRRPPGLGRSEAILLDNHQDNTDLLHLLFLFRHRV
jgi:hypothetical protein